MAFESRPFLAATLGAALMAAGAGPAVASPDADAPAALHAILADYDAFWNRNDPIGAGQRGDVAAQALWPDDSPAEEARRHRLDLEFKRRLDAVPVAALAGEDALNRELLEARLAIEAEAQATVGSDADPG